MKTPEQIIVAPIITEKSMRGVTEKKYTFKVAKNANKIEIAKAVEEKFEGNKVVKVNIVNVRGVARRRNYRTPIGHTSAWKKAIVTLTQDSKGIEFFESMQ